MIEIIDLSETLYEGTPVVIEKIRDSYEDPPYYTEEWASIAQKGYSVHAIHMGTHSGTHIDAPSHFLLGGATIDGILPEQLVGWAIVMDFTGRGGITSEMLIPFKERLLEPEQTPVLISYPTEYLSVSATCLLASLKPKSLVIACGFNEPDEMYVKSQAFLNAGIPLIQRVLPEKVKLLRDGDLIIAAPLKLLSMDGSPARVYAIRGICPINQ